MHSKRVYAIILLVMLARSAKKSKKISAKRKEGFSWKKSKAARKARKKIRFLFFAVLSLVLTTLLLTAFSIYKFAKAPLISASLGSIEKNEEWQGEDDLNVLFLVVGDINKTTSSLKGAYILKIVPQSQNYFIVNLPIFADCDLAERYGEGSLSKAFVIGNVRLTQETVFKQLAVYSNSYVLIDEKGISEIKEMFGEVDLKDISKNVSATKLYLNPNFLKFLKTRVKSNLSMGEIFRVLGFVRGENSGKVFEINEESFKDRELFDVFWKSYILRGITGEENARIMILNGAEIAGLAGWGGRVVENSGLTLLDVGNTEKKYEKSFLVSVDPLSKTSQKLSRVFGIAEIKDRDAVESGTEPFFRGEVVVILGLDIGNVL